MSDDRARAFALTPVSRETSERLERYIALLLEWQQHTNLIANSTIPDVWTRHVADSLQIIEHAPQAKRWVDLGSGAGFPGIVIACAIAGQEGARVDLIESRQKKAQFLREAAAAAQVPAVVHAARIEDCGDRIEGQVDIVTARALASLKDLCRLAFPLISRGAVGLFHKGQDVEVELTEASKYWSIAAELLPSKTSSEGRIVRITGLAPRKPGKKK